MNTAMVTAINTNVALDDELWILGDLAMGNIDVTLPILKRFNAKRIVLVPGNHDKCHSMHSKSAYWIERYQQVGIDIAPEWWDMELSDGTVVAYSHFPYSGESVEGRTDRFMQNRPTDEGRWLLCGHVHTAWRQRGRQINVGIDAWGGQPVSEITIMEMVNSEPVDQEIYKWERPPRILAS